MCNNTPNSTKNSQTGRLLLFHRQIHFWILIKSGNNWGENYKVRLFAIEQVWLFVQKTNNLCVLH